MTDTQQPPAAPQPPPAAPPPPAGGDGEGSRIQSIQELSARQDRMDGKLDTLLAKFGIGSSGQQPQPQQQGTAGQGSRPGEMQEQMRQAIRDVRAEEAAAAARAAAGQQQGQQQPPAEQKPREVTLRGKAKLQRRLFGADPS